MANGSASGERVPPQSDNKKGDERMKNFLILVGLGTAGMFGVIQLHLTWQASDHRAELAQSWSTDDIQTVAVGPLNKTLLVTPIDYRDRTVCDSVVSQMVYSASSVKILTTQGFDSVACGNVQEKVQSAIILLSSAATLTASADTRDVRSALMPATSVSRLPEAPGSF
jgi:hypothetical protein